jgi:hypothetical protein
MIKMRKGEIMKPERKCMQDQEKNTETVCYYCFYYEDRCTYYDSSVQLCLSENEGEM